MPGHRPRAPSGGRPECTRALVYFGVFLAALLVLVFGRQAYLLVDNRRAIDRERSCSRRDGRRNHELEALTGLATTMTQTLEEAPIVERASRCCTSPPAPRARRCTSASRRPLELHAVAGAWHDEHAWADGASTGRRRPRVRHARRPPRSSAFPLAARGNRIGAVTLMRARATTRSTARSSSCSACWPTSSRSPCRTRATTARSSSRRSATRSPASTTGASSSRRSRRRSPARERYGSPVSLVIFDVDDFKPINDTLRPCRRATRCCARSARSSTGLIRPMDSFARIGGEEFGLLLPETAQLDALLVAERLRTAIARHADHPGPAGHASAAASPPARRTRRPRGARAARRRARCTGPSATARTCARWPARSTSTEDGRRAARRAARPPLRPRRRRSTPSPCTRATTPRTSPPTRWRSARRSVSTATASSRLRRAALLHDIGKVAVAARDPRQARRAERRRVRRDQAPPDGGRARCSRHAGLHEEARWVRHHHERVDGSGYPDGLRRRRDPARGAHHLRGRLVRGDDLRPALPPRHGRRGRRWPSCAAAPARQFDAAGRRGSAACRARRAHGARPARCQPCGLGSSASLMPSSLSWRRVDRGRRAGERVDPPPVFGKAITSRIESRRPAA